jgi:hypothetical protein
VTVDELHDCDPTLRRDPRAIEALAERRITNMHWVLIDTWPYGAHLVHKAYRGRRIGWADVWYRKAGELESYANPITGLQFVVDLNRMDLLEVEDANRPRGAADDGRVRARPLPGQRLRQDRSRWRSSSPRASSSRSTAICCAGRSGRCGSTARRGSVLLFDPSGHLTWPLAHARSGRRASVSARVPETPA